MAEAIEKSFIAEAMKIEVDKASEKRKVDYYKDNVLIAKHKLPDHFKMVSGKQSVKNTCYDLIRRSEMTKEQVAQFYPDEE